MEAQVINQNNFLNPFSFYLTAKNDKKYELLLSVANDTIKIEAKNEKNPLMNYKTEKNFGSLKEENKLFRSFEDIDDLFENLVDMFKEKEKILISEEKNELILIIPINFGKNKEIIFKLNKEPNTSEEKISFLLKNLEEKDNLINNLTKKINSLEEQNKIFSEYFTEINKPDFLEEGNYIIFSPLLDNSCLEYVNDGHKLRLAIYEKNKKNQIFKVKKYDNIHYCIYNDLGEILTTPSTNLATEIYFSPSVNYKDNQMWFIVKYGKFYCINSSASPDCNFRCLDVTDTWGKVGDKIIIWNRHFGKNQLFNIKKINY